MFKKSSKQAVLLTLTSVTLVGCQATQPQLGGGDVGGGTVSGAAAGSSSVNKSGQLESCAEPLGTAAILEDNKGSRYGGYGRNSQYQNLENTIPVIRLIIQQSNCFVVVERGKSLKAIEGEREIANSGETRQDSKFGKGQLVAADYTISPDIQFSQKGTGSIGGLVGGKLGSIGAVVAGGLKKNEISTTLLLIDNRSSVQLSVSTGYAKNYDFDLGAGLSGSRRGGQTSAYTNSPEGKIITAAFADAYNQMVISLRSYQTQEVKNGLGKGGQLGVGK